MKTYYYHNTNSMRQHDPSTACKLCQDAVFLPIKLDEEFLMLYEKKFTEVSKRLSDAQATAFLEMVVCNLILIILRRE